MWLFLLVSLVSDALLTCLTEPLMHLGSVELVSNPELRGPMIVYQPSVLQFNITKK